MSVTIPLQPVVNQTLSIVLDNTVHEIALTTANNVIAFSLTRDNVVLLTNLRVVAGTPLIPYTYLEQGNFIFLTENDALPDYRQFNITQFLVYLTPAELAAPDGSA